MPGRLEAGSHEDAMKRGGGGGLRGANGGSSARLSSQGVGRGLGHRESACHLVVYYKYDCRMKVEYCKYRAHHASM